MKFATALLSTGLMVGSAMAGNTMSTSVASPVPIPAPTPSVSSTVFPWERLDKNNAVLLILDIQEGLFSVARDWDATLYREAIMAHAAIGTVFTDIPVILTSSAENGPNGPIPQEIRDWYPNAPFIKRQGEVDAWDNADFRAAIKATNRTQIIIAGIVTDVCTAFLARSLRAEGYSVWANFEASGTTTKEIRDISNDQLIRAGVNVVSMFAIVCDLMRDWRNTPGAAELLPYFDRYMPAYGMVARAHRAAKEYGVIIEGENLLPR